MEPMHSRVLIMACIVLVFCIGALIALMFDWSKIMQLLRRTLDRMNAWAKPEYCTLSTTAGYHCTRTLGHKGPCKLKANAISSQQMSMLTDEEWIKARQRAGYPTGDLFAQVDHGKAAKRLIDPDADKAPSHIEQGRGAGMSSAVASRFVTNALRKSSISTPVAPTRAGLQSPQPVRYSDAPVQVKRK
jgi:hypothetical protein